MILNKVQTADHTIIHLSGRFDAHQVSSFNNAVEPLKGSTELDFTEVQFIDSTGLAALVSLYKKAQASRTSLRISHVQDTVRLIFEITKLDTLLPLKATA